MIHSMSADGNSSTAKRNCTRTESACLVPFTLRLAEQEERLTAETAGGACVK
jgi:hypothetical protein